MDQYLGKLLEKQSHVSEAYAIRMSWLNFYKENNPVHLPCY